MSAASRTIKIVLLGEGDIAGAQVFRRICQVRWTETKSANSCLAASGRVGKTSLALRFVHNTFDHSQQATFQASFLSKQVTAAGKEVDLAIWDTAGQERFHALGPIYYRDAQAALLVYDITDADSFTRVKTWVQELRQMVGPFIVIAIAANKQDLSKQQIVSSVELQAYAASINALHFGTSAKTGSGLQDLFQEITDKVIAQLPSPGTSQGRPGGRLIVANEQDGQLQPASKNSLCC